MLISINTLAIAQEKFEKVNSYSDDLIDPTQLIAFEDADDNTVFIVDPSNRNSILRKLDLSDRKEIGRQRYGHGPGEVTGTGRMIISPYEEGYWVWDSAAQRGMIYDENLNFIEDITSSGGAQSFVAPVSNQNVATWSIFSMDQFVNTRKISKDLDIHDEVSNSISNDDYTELNPIAANPLVRQGETVADGSSIFKTFQYASYVIKITSDGIDYIASEPEPIGFPESESDGDGFSAPSHSDFPKATLDATADSRYIYTLHSGRKFDEGRVREVILTITGKMSELEIEYNSSDRVLVFGKQTGTFVDEITLPERAELIAATDTYFNIYTTFERNEGEIIQYRKSEHFTVE